MRVYLQPPQPSRGLDRIAHALRRYAPASVEVCEFPRNVDLTVIYAIGRRDHVQRQVEEILSRGKQYAIIQCCLRSTMSPSTFDWVNIWHGAVVVWSYYDLQEAFEFDAAKQFAGCYLLTNFYHAPLGADAQVFKPCDVPKQFTIATSGVSRLQESVRECYLATQAVNGQMFHVGDFTKWFNGDVTFSNGIDDLRLSACYSMCQFVSGLRRTEGFELPAVEGLLCGARPVVFDTPDYRWNYREFAEYVHEGTRAEVVDQLVQLFKAGPRPVSDAELHEARHWFNWERICGEFWNRCLQS